jgi:DNA-binding CsgD family transcriptional regulator
MRNPILDWLLITFALSNREAEIAYLVSGGLTNKEVASEAYITEKTVKFHMTNVYKKMGIRSRSQLVVMIMKKTAEIGSTGKVAETAVAPVIENHPPEAARDLGLPTGI